MLTHGPVRLSALQKALLGWESLSQELQIVWGSDYSSPTAEEGKTHAGASYTSSFLNTELALFSKFLAEDAWLWVAAAALKYQGEASCGVHASAALGTSSPFSH